MLVRTRFVSFLCASEVTVGRLDGAIRATENAVSALTTVLPDEKRKVEPEDD